MSDAGTRRRVLTELLEEGAATSQAELIEALEAAGVAATQPVVSRDLRALGAVKHDGRYVLPAADRVTPLESLRSLLREARPAGAHLVVVVCEPGAASAIARALEAEPGLGLLGTVAGDDTVFAAVPHARAGRRLCTLVRGLL